MAKRTLLDQIKDEIDRLHEIKREKARKAAAVDLVEYIALHHNDCYPVIARMWRWLIAATAEEVRSIPLTDDIETLPAWVNAGARDLIGFSMNAAVASPRRRLSAGARKLRERGRVFYGWTHELRERVASQVPYVKHWRVIEGDYTAAPDIDATWFIDPMYQGPAGNHYVHGSRGFDYLRLAAWCRARRGQRIVCEQAGATWLPFRPLGSFKSGPRTRFTSEAVWP